MSFVSIVLCKEYLSVMADSRSSEVYKDGRFHKVISENEEKIIPMTNFSFYTITGISEYAKEFIENSRLEVSIVNERGILKNTADIMKWFNSSIKHIGYKNSFGLSIGGKSIDGDFKFYSFNSDDKIINEIKYQENELKYELSVPIGTDYELVENKFKWLYNEIYDGTIETMLQVQQNLNNCRFCRITYCFFVPIH